MKLNVIQGTLLSRHAHYHTLIGQGMCIQSASVPGRVHSTGLEDLHLIPRHVWGERLCVLQTYQGRWPPLVSGNDTLYGRPPLL